VHRYRSAPSIAWLRAHRANASALHTGSTANASAIYDGPTLCSAVGPACIGGTFDWPLELQVARALARAFALSHGIEMPISGRAWVDASDASGDRLVDAGELYDGLRMVLAQVNATWANTVTNTYLASQVCGCIASIACAECVPVCERPYGG